MADDEIQTRISELVRREHELRTRATRGELDRDDEHAALEQLERTLDQCWDLLRQRRARRSAGQDPDGASVRPAEQVQNYLS